MDKSLVINNVNMNDINVLLCGYEQCEPAHLFGPAIRGYHLFHYILSGEGRFESGGREYHLKAGQGFLICPHFTTLYQADAQNPWEYLWIGFEGEWASRLLEQANLSQDAPIFTAEPRSVAHGHFLQLYEYIQNGHTNEMCILGSLYSILGGLIRDNGRDNALTRPRVYVSRAVSYINSNYHLPITVEGLSGSLGIDRKYFSSIFKEYTKVTPMHYILQIKVGKACELLKNTSSSVSDIARSVGYEDIFSFSRMFSKFMRVSPSAYRKSNDITM